MLDVVLFSFAIHKYIIKVYNHKKSNAGPEHLIHQPYEGARGIEQPK